MENLFLLLRQTFLRVFCGFDIGCFSEVDVLFQSVDAIETSRQGNSIYVELFVETHSASWSSVHDTCCE